MRIVCFLLLLLEMGYAKIETHELDIVWMNEYLHRNALMVLLKVG
jgi:hypothetical protein